MSDLFPRIIGFPIEQNDDFIRKFNVNVMFANRLMNRIENLMRRI